jgi:hypothetical protein
VPSNSDAGVSCQMGQIYHITSQLLTKIAPAPMAKAAVPSVVLFTLRVCRIRLRCHVSAGQLEVPSAPAVADSARYVTGHRVRNEVESCRFSRSQFYTFEASALGEKPPLRTSYSLHQNDVEALCQVPSEPLFEEIRYSCRRAALEPTCPVELFQLRPRNTVACRVAYDGQAPLQELRSNTLPLVFRQNLHSSRDENTLLKA